MKSISIYLSIYLSILSFSKQVSAQSCNNAGKSTFSWHFDVHNKISPSGNNVNVSRDYIGNYHTSAPYLLRANWAFALALNIGIKYKVDT